MDNVLAAIDVAVAAQLGRRNSIALEAIYALIGESTEWDPTTPEELVSVVKRLVARPAESPFVKFGNAASGAAAAASSFAHLVGGVGTSGGGSGGSAGGGGGAGAGGVVLSKGDHFTYTTTVTISE